MKERSDWRRWLIKLLGFSPEDKDGLLEHLRHLQSDNIYFDKREMEMIEGVLSMDKWEIGDVMIAKNDIIHLSENDGYDCAVKVVCQHGHSRYPVLSPNGEEVVGILLAKDLLKYVGNPQDFVMTEVMRKAYRQPVSRRLDDLLDIFLKNRSHMMVAIDEYELTAGVVTIEDVLERIVGEIEDEYDTGDDQQTDAEGKTTVKGALSVEEFNAQFNAELPEADTIAGWLAAEMGRVPQAGDKHTSFGFIFEVEKADDRRVHEISVKSVAPAHE